MTTVCIVEGAQPVGIDLTSGELSHGRLDHQARLEQIVHLLERHRSDLVVGAVIGEWVGASQGLGYLVMYGSQTLRTDLMFAALVFIAVLGMVLYLAVVLIERLVSWEPADAPIGGL